MPDSQIELPLAGETMLALSEAALFWPRERTLFVADVHFGKDATFRHARRWVPPGTTDDDSRRLSQLIERQDAERLVILGDTFHSEHAREEATLQHLRQWRDGMAAEVLLIRGNHDRRAAELARALNLSLVDEGHVTPPFALHHSPLDRAGRQYVLCGHVHPVVVVRGLARQRLRIRCFWAQTHQCVLPAFGGFTGGYAISPAADDRVILVAGTKVMEARARAPKRPIA